MQGRRRNIGWAVGAALLLGLGGCATTHAVPAAPQTTTARAADQTGEEAALKSVLEAVSGKQVTDQTMQKLARQLRNNPQARSAVESVASALTGEQPLTKYCPITGKRYSAKFTVCPIHHVPLKEVR